MKFNLSPEKIKYIKLTYDDNSGISHCAKAAFKSFMGGEIYACAKVDMPLYIKTPQDIQLSIICDEGLYRASTILTGVENEEPYAYFTIITPQDYDYQQKREFFRVRMDGNVIMRFGSKITTGKIYDISANGIRLQLDENTDIPQDVTLDILFEPKSIKTAARYIRTDCDEGIQKAAFCFVNLSDTGRDIISQKCIQKQLEEKRKQFE